MPKLLASGMNLWRQGWCRIVAGIIIPSGLFADSVGICVGLRKILCWSVLRWNGSDFAPLGSHRGAEILVRFNEQLAGYLPEFPAAHDIPLR